MGKVKEMIQKAREGYTEHPNQLVIDAVIEDLKTDFANQNYDLIETLLQAVPRKVLVTALPEDPLKLSIANVLKAIDNL